MAGGTRIPETLLFSLIQRCSGQFVLYYPGMAMSLVVENGKTENQWHANISHTTLMLLLYLLDSFYNKNMVLAVVTSNLNVY